MQAFPAIAHGVRVNVVRVDERDQNIHVEQKRRHGNSLRSRFINSGVTGVVPGLAGSNGTPFRLEPVFTVGRNAWRASSEMTSPTLLCCRSAIPLAIASTSSSMASVVRILSLLIKHRAPYTKYLASSMEFRT
jgi:hypothetical protein